MKKLILFLLLSSLLYGIEPLIVREKQGFNFGKIIKSNYKKIIEPIDNLILNIHGEPYKKIKLHLSEIHIVKNSLFLSNIILLTTKELVLDKNGEIDLEIKGNLNIDESNEFEKIKTRIQTPFTIEYE